MSYRQGNMPFIKTEPDEHGNNPNRYMQTQNYAHHQNSFNQFHDQDSASINPSELTMSNGNFSGQYGFGSQNMASSFSMGNSGYDDNELLDSLDMNNNGQHIVDDFSTLQQFNNQPRGAGGMPVGNQTQMSNAYSNTPEGPPIQSPYLGQVDYSHFRNLNSLPQHMSPLQNPQYMSGKRPSMQAHRKSSDQRSPMTPRTAAMAGLQIGTPESGSLVNGRPIRTPSLQNRHQKTMSGQYDSTPGSLGSYLDSPLSSPGNALHHPGIGETIGKHGSLPTKVENGHSTSAQETVEAKKRRRRASHNAVERRRRDNINERIQDLSHLVPQHRLDDDKVKKQLANAGPLSPTVGATGISPPNTTNTATSLLAAASTVGNITIGLPIEDREKGPNKGDILNGAVSWTRDLMWALNQKYLQEDELVSYITSLGGTWPFQLTDDEKRMRSEVQEAIEKNGVETFTYTRTDGSGLRVPKHTTLSGERLMANQNNSSLSPQSNFELSPGFHSGGSGTGSGSASNGPGGQPQFWHSAGHTGISFKEEDEFMEMT
jgi:Helix-loop-helix DNA-binding domain